MRLPQPPRQAKRQRPQPQNVVLSSNTAGNKKQDVLTISMKPERHASAKQTKAAAAPLPANTKTIQVVDMKETRREILSN